MTIATSLESKLKQQEEILRRKAVGTETDEMSASSSSVSSTTRTNKNLSKSSIFLNSCSSNSSSISITSASSVSSYGSTRSRTKKSVRFDEGRNQVLEITHLHDMPLQEIADVWYGIDEYVQIKDKLKETLKRMMRGESFKGSSQYSIRGLENRTREGAMELMSTRIKAYDAVLEEQKRQWNADQDNQELIARYYSECAKRSAKVAVLRARIDEKSAMKIHAGVKTSSSRSRSSSPTTTTSLVKNQRRASRKQSSPSTPPPSSSAQKQAILDQLLVDADDILSKGLDNLDLDVSFM